MNNKEKQQKAIGILNKQIGKLDDPQYPADETWKVQTSSYIKEYFGEKSDQYEFIKKLTLRVSFGDGTERTIQNKGAARRFLMECIQLIENMGLYRTPRENILKTISHEVLIPSFLVIIGGIFSLGFYIGNINSNNDRYELKDELKSKNDSLKIYRNNIKDLNTRLKAVKPKTTNTTKQAS